MKCFHALSGNACISCLLVTIALSCQQDGDIKETNKKKSKSVVNGQISLVRYSV